MSLLAPYSNTAESQQGGRLTAELDPVLLEPNVFAVYQHEGDRPGLMGHTILNFSKGVVYVSEAPEEREGAFVMDRLKLNHNGSPDHRDKVLVQGRIFGLGVEQGTKTPVPGVDVLGAFMIDAANRVAGPDLEVLGSRIERLEGGVIDVVKWDINTYGNVAAGNGGRPWIADALQDFFRAK